MASFPPRRMVALPDFRQSTAASLVTFGRLSKMIPITPIGTLTCSMRIPFGRVRWSRTSPTGSGNSATCSIPFAMASTLSPSRRSLPIIALVNPFASAAARSLAFSARIAATRARNSAAMARNIAFFSPVLSPARAWAAARAFFPIAKTAS